VGFDLDRAEGGGASGAPVRLRPEIGYSSKPVVGAPITAVKRVAERLVHHVVQDAFDQTSLRLEHLARAVEDIEERAEERGDEALSELRAALDREVAARVETAAQVERLAAAVDELSALLGRLEARIARLERAADGPR
jgi:methyl-accepting chemotaxis protein